MATKIEKLQASLAKAEAKEDKKRMEKAVEYLDLVIETVKNLFHGQDYNDIASNISGVCGEVREKARGLLKDRQ